MQVHELRICLKMLKIYLKYDVDPLFFMLCFRLC